MSRTKTITPPEEDHSRDGLGKFYRTCEICGKPEYYGYSYEHTDCANEITRRERSPLAIRRMKWGNKVKNISAGIFSRDGNRCKHCGATDNLTIDHITPVSKGGSDNPENLQTLCRSCNSKKGAR